MEKRKHVYICEYCEFGRKDMFGDKTIDCNYFGDYDNRVEICEDVINSLKEEYPNLNNAIFMN